ncbi:MAG: hypothetical protein QXQ91_03840 [Nanopusillaceae archaeon]
MKKIDEGWHAEIFLTERNTIIKKFKKGLEKNYEKEKNFLLELKNYDFVPKIISWDDKEKWIEMEYINGKFLEDLNKEEIKKYIEKILDICYLLDKLKINKEEMHRPEKHIIILENRIVFIDWERAKKTKKPQNLNQFIQFLINKRIINISNELLNLLKEYKKSYSEESYNDIKNFIKIFL